MLSIAHGTTGALIATKIPNPLISIPLIIATHFLQDRVPHWDVGQGLGSHKKTKKAAFLQELLIDFPLSIILVYFFFQYEQPTLNISAWLGWFVCLLPDFIEFPANFLNTKLPFIEPITKIHELVHRSTPNKFWGLLPQFLTILAVYLLR